MEIHNLEQKKKKFQEILENCFQVSSMTIHFDNYYSSFFLKMILYHKIYFKTYFFTFQIYYCEYYGKYLEEYERRRMMNVGMTDEALVDSSINSVTPLEASILMDDIMNNGMTFCSIM